MPTITYEPEPVTVTSWRSKKPRTVYHYRVLIDGEWRATYRSQAEHSHAGFDLVSRIRGYDVTYRPGLAHNNHRYTQRISRDQFDAGVERALKDDTLPTLAEIERAHLIDQATNEHRAWESDRARHAHEIHVEMITEALRYYIESAPDTLDERQGEKVKAAKLHLTRIR